MELKIPNSQVTGTHPVEHGIDSLTAILQPSAASKVTGESSSKKNVPEPLPQEEFDDELLFAFKTESEEQLEAADKCLLDLESNPQDANTLNALFRAFHTIKGNAGFLRIDPTLMDLAHDAETVLSLCRSGDLVLSGNAFEMILESTALLHQLVAALGGPRGIPPSAHVSEACCSVRQALHTIASGASFISSSSPSNHNPPVASEKSSASSASGIESKGDPSDFFDTPTGNESTVQSDDLALTHLDHPTISGPTESTNTATSNVGIAPPTTPQISSPPVASQLTSSLSQDSDRKTSSSQAGNESLRVDRSRLDQLVELIGELVIAESMAQQDAINSFIDQTASPTRLRNLAQLNRITRTLQEISLSLRMVPLRSTFQKMTRVARDLTRKLSKDVDFIVEGENTELDKSVVDEIGDPLMHMVRNAIDHGIEKCPQERIAQGKPAQGKVTLRAFHQSGNIHIEIQDDGRGLDVARILAKAKQQKLVSDDANLSEQEILSLIFEPGFSTAEKVTDVSGRGVGMDVVRRNIQSLRGNIDIKTKKGEGSCFTIRLPLTLAIINGLIVRVGEGRFVIPTLSVTELMRYEGSQISTIAERYSILTVRDQNVPLVRLAKTLGLKEADQQSTNAIIVIVQEGNNSAAISVDEVLGQQQVVIKQLGHHLQGCRGVAGGAIMPDGQVGIILDVHGIIAQSCGA